ncbi:hypothetical protein [Leptospira noguchii]|uniref:hypothetical protein n=1 Tax=Leptospira noguchii TaxID=28182 RepID=UPI00031C4849|nr:hypothetical protein [Leptospira noguchii]
MSHFNYEICELRRRPVGSVALSLLFAPIFLRRTHVNFTVKILGRNYIHILKSSQTYRHDNYCGKFSSLL